MKSIKTKFILSTAILILLVCTGIGISIFRSASAEFTSSKNTSMEALACQGANVVLESLQKEWNALEMLSTNESICSPDVAIDKKMEVLHKEAKRVKAVDISFAGPDGKALAPDGVTVSDISEREYFKKAMKGENAVSDPIENKTVPGTLIITFAVPIKYNDAIVGVLFKVADGSCLCDITDKITFGETGTAYMINKEGTAVANTNRDKVLTQDNVSKNYKDDPKFKDMIRVQNEMFKGETGHGSYEYDGDVKYMAYTPVTNTNWIIAVTAKESETMAGVLTMLNLIIVVCVVGIVLAIIIEYFLSSYIVKPITMINNCIKIIAQGDFSQSISQKLLKNKDETGQLANSLVVMQESVRDMITTVQKESDNVKQVSINEADSVARLMDNIQEISSTTEELSAGSEETAASTEQMQASSAEIGVSLESMKQRTIDGANSVKEIHNRAESLKASAIESKEYALQLYKESEQTMSEAIEASSQVNEIKVLSEAILTISAQTNLLALNASIEAARAGEAGKGFTVVASEIGKLADGAQKSVNEIQKVTDHVVAAVENLKECATSLLRFVNTQVLGDYDKLVATGEQYSKDADEVSQIVTDIRGTTNELNETVQNIIKAIEEVSTAAQETAAGSTSIAEQTADMVNFTNTVLQLTEETKQTSLSLVSSVSKFIV